MGFWPIRSTQSRQLDEFERLARETEESLFRVAYRLTGNSDDAKDLLQESLVEAFEAFGRYQQGGRFDRWVMRIMTNTFIDNRRKKAVRPQTISLSDLTRFDDSDHAEYDLPDRGIPPEEALLASEFRTLLDKALSRIPDEYRVSMVLCDMEGFSYAEAARVMDCPEGTVRSRLHRARTAVRRMLEPYLDGAGVYP